MGGAHCNTLQHALQHTAKHCNPLQQTATHRDTLQHTAAHCSTLLHTATHSNTLSHTAAHCNVRLYPQGSLCAHTPHMRAFVRPHSKRVWAHKKMYPHSKRQRRYIFLLLKHAATRCNTLQHAATHCNTLQHTATVCNTLQHSATHCNTLQDTPVSSKGPPELEKQRRYSLSAINAGYTGPTR